MHRRMTRHLLWRSLLAPLFFCTLLSSSEEPLWTLHIKQNENVCIVQPGTGSVSTWFSQHPFAKWWSQPQFLGFRSELQSLTYASCLPWASWEQPCTIEHRSATQYHIDYRFFAGHIQENGRWLSPVSFLQPAQVSWWQSLTDDTIAALAIGVQGHLLPRIPFSQLPVLSTVTVGQLIQASQGTLLLAVEEGMFLPSVFLHCSATNELEALLRSVAINDQPWTATQPLALPSFMGIPIFAHIYQDRIIISTTAHYKPVVHNERWLSRIESIPTLPNCCALAYADSAALASMIGGTIALSQGFFSDYRHHNRWYDIFDSLSDGDHISYTTVAMDTTGAGLHWQSQGSIGGPALWSQYAQVLLRPEGWRRLCSSENLVRWRLRRELFPRMRAYQQQKQLDRDTDGIGEYGSLRAVGAGLTAVNWWPWGDDGYHYRLFLPTGTNAGLQSDLNPPLTHHDAQEQYWVCYAWPKRYGEAGKRCFAITERGRVHGRVLGEREPAWRDLFGGRDWGSIPRWPPQHVPWPPAPLAVP